MVPHDDRHAKLSRWMQPTDPILGSWIETISCAGLEYEVVTQADLCMIYSHEDDRSCCQLTKVNQEGPMYTRDADGRLIRGR